MESDGKIRILVVEHVEKAVLVASASLLEEQKLLRGSAARWLFSLRFAWSGAIADSLQPRWSCCNSDAHG